MPGPKSDGGVGDFASVLTNAMKPPAIGELEGKDLPDGFPGRVAPHHRIVDSEKEPDKIDGIAAYDFTIHREVFTIFRKWESCSRCQNDIAANKVALPPIGDIACPHITKASYEAISNDILAGKLLAGSEQESNLPDGTVMVSLMWYEKKFNKQRARQMARQAQKNTAVATSED